MSYITNTWKALSYLGVEDSLDYQLQRRIVLSNRLGIIIATVAFLFILLNITKGDFNVLTLGGVMLLCVFIMILNKFNHILLSRIIVCILPAVSITIVNILLKINSPEEVEIIHYISPRMIVASSIVLPFTLFTVNERRMTIIGSIVIGITILIYDPLHAYFNITFEQLSLSSAKYSVVYEDTFVMILLILSSSIFLLNLNKQFADRNQLLLKEAQDKNASMNENEEKLRVTLDEVNEARKEDEKRNWMAKGLADVGQILQANEDDITITYDKMISSVVSIIGANQGGLYLINDGEDQEVEIELVACYAYNRKKFLNKTIQPGQGLIGQCYLEAEQILLKEVPSDYVNITSGLGKSNPNTVLIVPFKLNDKVEAILEVASFKNFETHQIDFLNRLGDGVASKVSTIKIDQRTKILLEKSQIQAEELRAQEEEMRQNMEELQATQEEMSRKEQEYLDRIAQLEKQALNT